MQKATASRIASFALLWALAVCSASPSAAQETMRTRLVFEQVSPVRWTNPAAGDGAGSSSRRARQDLQSTAIRDAVQLIGNNDSEAALTLLYGLLHDPAYALDSGSRQIIASIAVKGLLTADFSLAARTTAATFFAEILLTEGSNDIVAIARAVSMSGEARLRESAVAHIRRLIENESCAECEATDLSTTDFLASEVINRLSGPVRDRAVRQLQEACRSATIVASWTK